MNGLDWTPLTRQSWRLALRWARRLPRHRGSAARLAVNRALVPLDPWRFYELGHLVAVPVDGRWLDISSPKLLPSLYRQQGRGDWVCTDLFSAEIEAWRVLDPQLDLRIEDARSLTFPDASFDGCLSISVIEHVPDDGDAQVMAEMWRVLKPGGVVRLTTNIARRPRIVTINRAIYGEASERTDDGSVFFERHYDDDDLDRRLLGLPWEVVRRDRVRQVNPRIEATYHRLAPASYLLGNALPVACARNFAPVASTSELADGEMGVVSLELRKPERLAHA